MIKAQELRIGNLVEWHTGSIEVINARMILSISEISPDHLTPKGIPITEEWLLKFGFESQIGFIKLIRKPFQDCSLEISHNDANKWYCYFRNFNKGQLDDFVILRNDLKYVHQLQNLFFSLTGEELTIKE